MIFGFFQVVTIHMEHTVGTLMELYILAIMCMRLFILAEWIFQLMYMYNHVYLVFKLLQSISIYYILYVVTHSKHILLLSNDSIELFPSCCFYSKMFHFLMIDCVTGLVRMFLILKEINSTFLIIHLSCNSKIE